MIRPGRDGDAAAVAALWTEGYSGRGPGEGRQDPYAESEYFDSARDGVVAVAEEGGALLGVVVFLPPGAVGWAAGPGEAALTRLVVAESARGRGLGRALAEHCGELARAASAEAIALWSRPYQVGAHRLYESLGYRRAPARDGRDADGPRWFFRNELGSPR